MAEAQFYPLTVAGVQPETDNAIRVSFTVPEKLRDHFRYKPGQYLTLQSELDGEPVRRSYSICSGVHDPAIEIAIKRVEGGLFSNFANDSLREGDTLEVMPPQGNFHVELDAQRSRNYLFIASGSGITPVISNIRSILAEEPGSCVTLLYGNQRSNTIMFREALGFLKNRYLTRLQWVNILSKEDQGADILNGRLNNRKGAELNRRLIDLKNYDEYFICGPESMISEVSRGLRGVGVTEEHIHYELFAASAADASAVIAKHHARALAYAGKASEVTIVMDGRGSHFSLAADGENVLDAGLNHGLDLPFSCKGGVCSTCKARLLEGSVDMDITHGLEPGEIEQGFILTCQAHPVSEKIVVDFDQK
ncbi:phenylacetate-CoA oxygenase/reductase subunit PaaK [Kineobactrum sediminis]|uniref:Phenylacetate-CoA oxygenase/reductase subunit PaaK n=1 Tax=Kineobactrum sediminis TaxID=1905677 RepID=A0A2N5Y1W1_9GAMM|nr:1,2-phenylacetyl-CoA epoxidase subunit PaaE [Kineobactrum sediminis]PLW82372.1 phenylacetate-CoA oxygenase/reductase subunit PaaK [Kineobactrum sediminis]